jgi:Cu/Ag efflux pump CusA
VPWLDRITSRSMPGLSAIDLVFERGTDLYQARQMVQERMTQAKALPNVGTPPVMVQPEASTGRVAMISLRSTEVSAVQMSVLARWQIRPRLMSVPGVANVSIWGQQDRQLQVHPDPERLHERGVTLTQLIETTGNALWVSPLSFVEASTPGTGGFVETPNQRLGVQHVSPISTPDQLADVALESQTPAAGRIGDVADVVEDHPILIGDAADHGGPGLMLVVEKLPGASTSTVTRDVETAMAAMRPGLSGITVDTHVYRPASYLGSALRHLGVAGLLGLALLLVVLGLLTRSWRAALVCAVAVPLPLVAAAWVLQLRGQTLTTMTAVGLAVALAAVVDDAVTDVHVVGAGTSEPDGLVRALVSSRGPLVYGTLVALLATAPLLAVGGVPGAFLTPAVTTFLLALGISLLVALTVTPALIVLLYGVGRGQPVREPAAHRWAASVVDRFVAPSLGRPVRAGIAVTALAALALPLLATGTAGHLLPEEQDRNVLVRLEAAPGTSLPEMDRVSALVSGEIRRLPGVAAVGSHSGRAVVGDEVVDVNAAELWVRLDPDTDAVRALSAVRALVREYPGLRSRVRTYADDQVSAADTSTPGDLVVRVYGQDMATLRETAERVSQVMATVPGVLTPTVQPQASEPTVQLQVDLAAAQRHGLRPGDVRREASTLVSGLVVGSLYEQQKIFDVVVWGGPADRQDVRGLEDLAIDTPSGEPVRLGDVATVRIAPAPAVITHDAVSRSLDVTATLRGRDVGDVSAELTGRLRGLAMPLEYRAEVLGDAAQRQDSARRVALVALAAAVAVLLLLQAALRSWRGAALLVVLLPLAGAGVLLVAPALGGPVSVGPLAALVAVLALATRQSLVLLRRAAELRDSAPDAATAVRQATSRTAGPVLVTALATAAALVPVLLLGPTAGLEALHPLAVSLLAGLGTSVVVVLFVVPALYLALAAPRGNGPSLKEVEP